MAEAQLQPAPVRQIQRGGIAVGAVGVVLLALGWFFSADDFFHAYLFAYIFWLGLGLGCLALAMVHRVVGGAWGFALRRVFESGGMTLPAMALLFVPLLFGLPSLYEWTHPEAVRESAVLQSKAAYLNAPFWIGRAALYFVVWCALAVLLNRWSLRQDRTAEPALTARLKRLSLAGLILYVLTITFASVDWVMSLEPEWYSTIFGMIFITSQGLQALAFAIAVAVLLADQPPLRALLTPDRFRDLGNLLLTFVMLWTYVAFSQFIIIWAGNLPEEVVWYSHRIAGGWKWIAIFLVIFHFFAPFFLLLFRFNKRSPRILAAVALGIMAVHTVSIFWLVLPAFRQTGLALSWLDVVAPIALGGIWLAVFARQLGGKALVPLHDPALGEGAHE